MLSACARSKFSAASRARTGIEGCRAWLSRHCSQILNVACSSQLSTLIAGLLRHVLDMDQLLQAVCQRAARGSRRAGLRGRGSGAQLGLPVCGAGRQRRGRRLECRRIEAARGTRHGLTAGRWGRPGMLAGQEKRRSEMARSAVVASEVRRTKRAAHVRMLRRRGLRPIAGAAGAAGARAACALARGWAACRIASGGETDCERAHG